MGDKLEKLTVDDSSPAVEVNQETVPTAKEPKADVTEEVKEPETVVELGSEGVEFQCELEQVNHSVRNVELAPDCTDIQPVQAKVVESGTNIDLCPVDLVCQIFYSISLLASS